MENSNFSLKNPGSSAPKVLLTDTDRRAYTARLGVALAKAGCDVCALVTRGHPILKTTVVQRTFSYSALRPVDSMQAAIDATAPDMIIPCDDRGIQHVHDLYSHVRSHGNSDSDTATLIERSLGRPESYSIVSARYELLRIAQEEGLRVPATSVVNTIDDFKSWRSKQAFPWVLKSDGTWGGRGVRIAHTLEEAEQFFVTLNRPFGLSRVIKRFCVNRDPFWIKPWWKNVRPSVIVQSHIQGRPANCGVVSWEGKVLAGIGVEVLTTDGSTGPASVVRVVDNPDMMICAERIARRLGLSGFFGLDFMIENGTGAMYLIEMNPRCTPLCHLQLGSGRDLIGSLSAQLSGQLYTATAAATDNDLIAYFPQAWSGSPELLNSSFQDVPVGEPALVEALLHSWPESSFLFRATNYLHELMHPQSTDASASHFVSDRRDLRNVSQSSESTSSRR